MAHRWRVLTVVSVTVFMVSLDLFIVNIAFPDIAHEFGGTSVSSLSWVLTAYTIVFAALLVPAGRLADRFGRRRVFLAGLGLFLAGSALCGAAPSVGALVAARVVQAVGAAALMPTSLALLLPEFPPQERSAAIGVWAAIGGVAAAAGPPLGGLLVQVDWRLVFLVNLPVGLVAGFFAVRMLRESREAGGPLPDLVGTGLLIASIAVLALGLVKAPVWGWGSPAFIACLAGAALGLGLFVVRSAHHPSPVVDLAMLRVRSFALSCSSALLFFSAFGAMLLGNVLFLTEVWHRSILVAGLSLAPGPVMAAAFAVPAGRIADRAGHGRLAALGCTLFAAGCGWWLWHMGQTPDYAGDMLPGQLLTGTGVGLTIAPLSAAAAASLPPARFATGSAILTMARQIGSVLGVAALIAIVGASPGLAGFQGGWRYMIIAALLGAGAALSVGVVTRHEPLTAPAPAPAG